jgi:hypothetical protein
MVLVTFPERKVTRRKGGTDISPTPGNGYAPHPNGKTFNATPNTLSAP